MNPNIDPELKAVSKRFHELYKEYLNGAGITDKEIVAYLENRKFRKKIPSEFEGYPVEIRVIGKIVLQ